MQLRPKCLYELSAEQSDGSSTTGTWETCARQHVGNVWGAIRSFLDLAISYLAGESASNILLSQVIDPFTTVYGSSSQRFIS